TRIKYQKFLETYEPIKACTGINDLDDFFRETNLIFALVYDTERKIDFIQIETREIEENGLKLTEMYARNKNTGKEIGKSDALKAYSEATVKLGGAAVAAYKLAKSSAALYKIFSKDPSLLLTYMMKIKKSVSALYMTVKVIPLIQRKIKENSEALKQLKNN
ncbi:MAG: hypothetical protein PHY71_08265, partial [Bacteroidaceae bacterium]|nr:hypothetical protein [Bacteroidaceae bacterium]